MCYNKHIKNTKGRYKPMAITSTKELIEKIDGIKKGTYARIEYEVSLDKKLRAKYRKDGISIKKHTATTIKMYDYDHTKERIEAEKNGIAKRTDGPKTKWVIEDKVIEYLSTGTMCLVAKKVSKEKSNTHTEYTITYGDGRVEKTENIDYSWLYNSEPTDMFCVNLKNIISINNELVEMA